MENQSEENSAVPEATSESQQPAASDPVAMTTQDDTRDDAAEENQQETSVEHDETGDAHTENNNNNAEQGQTGNTADDAENSNNNADQGQMGNTTDDAENSNNNADQGQTGNTADDAENSNNNVEQGQTGNTTDDAENSNTNADQGQTGNTTDDAENSNNNAEQGQTGNTTNDAENSNNTADQGQMGNTTDQGQTGNTTDDAENSNNNADQGQIGNTTDDRGEDDQTQDDPRDDPADENQQEISVGQGDENGDAHTENNNNNADQAQRETSAADVDKDGPVQPVDDVETTEQQVVPAGSAEDVNTSSEDKPTAPAEERAPEDKGADDGDAAVQENTPGDAEPAGQPEPEDNGQEDAAEEDLQTKQDKDAPEQQMFEAESPRDRTVTSPQHPLTQTVGLETEVTDEPPVDPHAPSPVARFGRDVTATVKFVLMPSGQVATLRCRLEQTLAELKQHFAQELKIPDDVIVLMFDAQEVENNVTLGDLGVGPNGIIQLELQSADPHNSPIKPFKPRQEYQMPDVITVRVEGDGGGYKDLVVEIIRTTRKNPYLGGYRHKKTGNIYHHAAAQTMQKPRPPAAVERFCRDTQTVQERHRPQQTTNDMSTQMTKVGTYVSNLTDKLMVPGKYTTADECHWNILNKVIIMQKYYRRWLAKRYVQKVREDSKRRLEWERQEELRKKKEKEDRIRREFERRMNPKSKEDFDLLYHALEKWRQEEVGRIESTLTGAERKAALCQLLDQETQLIASVGRHKIEADTENKHKNIQKFLDKAAAPKKWKGPDGKYTEMDTPYTIRAQELRDIYNSINMKYLTQDERLDVLLTLKHTVKEHDCKLTQDIIELTDREADLLMRGVKESNLDGLRKRISTLFLQYIKTPTFNPEASRLLKVPQDPSKLRRNIYFCSSCNMYLPSTDFQISSNSRTVEKCRRCNKIDNDARVRQDYSHYRYMLNALRKSEEAYGDDSKIAYLMQENDLRHLVEKVWSSQSVLSAWEDLYDLVLVRWDHHQEWSPWNCILMTKEESTAHDKLENLQEAYSKSLAHKVKQKHTMARNYFSRLPGMAEYMRSRANSSTTHGPSVTGKGCHVAPAKA